jgi:hypothetical protein
MQNMLAQISEKNQVPNELTTKEQQLLLSLPPLELPLSYKNKSIPYMVDNSALPYFRDMFSQAGMSCGQASSTGICFTYEMNCSRDLEANVNEHLYPTHFVYDWVNGDWGSSGASYYHTLEVLRTVGTPNQAEYGGTIDAGGNLRWMTGYDLYYSAMHNRISGAYCIPELGTADGLNILKNWINDHLNGSEHGGCAIFYSTVPTPDATLPAGTEEGGKNVVTQLTASTSHSMAILGYNDSIRYDYNNDGQYTNNIDINGDGQVDMNDWEIGGIKMCNTYSGGPAWADSGFCYFMYKAIAGGALWHDLAHVMYTKETYEPLLTVKASVTYTNRKRIKIVAGMSTNLSATVPDYILDFPIFDYQGGDRYMTGGTEEIDKTLEFGLDITPLLNYLEPGETARFFLQITENDDDGWGSGQIDNFSVIEYSSGSPVETISDQENVSIIQNGVTRVWVNKTINHNPPQIIDSQLPAGAILSAYSHTMSASDGTPPYRWSWDMDYEISETSESFPTGGTTITASAYNLVNLDFEFPFYGEKYHDIYIGNNGLIVFNPGFSNSLPYNYDDAIIFLHAKSIAPLFNTTIASTVKKISNANSITLIFDNNKFDYAVTLYDDGTIKYYYTNCNFALSDIYTCGVSNGDLMNEQRLFFEDHTNVENGFTYTLTPKAIPEEFEISENGIISGTPTHEYIAENFYIKVKDDNNLTETKTLQFVTDGLILQFYAHTDDDEILEYNETVDVDITATNPMDAPVTNVTITASSTDPYVTITDNSSSILQLNADASTTLTDAIQFTIATSVPNQHQADFIFNIQCDQGNWNYPTSFELFAPVIEPGLVNISDGNDNLIAAGENFTANTNIWNNGGADASNIAITFETDDPYLTLLSNSGNITELLPNHSSIVSIDAITANNVPMQHEAIITMNITADNGFTTSEEFSIIIHTPIIEENGFLVNDADNGCLDADETSDILIGLINVGQIDATNLNFILSTDDEYITINNNTDALSLIAMGNTGTVTFNVSAHSDAPMAHLVTFNLNITGDNGLDLNLQINTIIGILIETWESGDLNAMEWTTDGSNEWHPVTDVVYEGAYSLRSGVITHNQVSNLRIQMFVVAEGDISFAYKVSSESNYDFLEFLVDDVVVSSWSGNLGWSTFSYTISPGEHNFVWRYRKDFSVDGGSDCAWVDNITFPAVNNLPAIFDMSTYSIIKNMYPDQIDTDTVILYNFGGGFIDITTNTEFFDTDVKSIDGSTLSCDILNFTPGESLDLTFTIYNGSPDMEWIKSIDIAFPEGFTVNSSTDFVGGSGGSLFSNGDTGNAAQLQWSTSNTWGAVHGNESATCTVNVSVDPSFANVEAYLNYTINGDIYGTDPHTLEGTITMANLNELWLHVTPQQTTIPFQSETYLYLTFNTENMTPGTYEAVIHIHHNGEVSDLPITLNIWTVDIEETSSNNKIKVYPNPFTENVNLCLPSDYSSIKRIELSDATGKLIDVIWSDKMGELPKQLVFSKAQHLAPGSYYLKFISETENISIKLIKID